MFEGFQKGCRGWHQRQQWRERRARNTAIPNQSQNDDSFSLHTIQKHPSGKSKTYQIKNSEKKKNKTPHKKRGPLKYGWFLLGTNPEDEDDVISSVFCGSDAIFTNMKEAFKNGVAKEIIVFGSPEEEHDWLLRKDAIASLYDKELAEVYLQ